MHKTISILAFFLVLIILIPWNELFPSRNLRKLIKFLDEERFNSIVRNNSLFHKFLHLSEGIYRILKIKYKPDRYKLIKNKIQTAGINETLSVEAYIGAKIFLALISFSYVLLFFLIQRSTLIFSLLITTPVIGYIVPDSILAGKIRKRQWQIQVELPYVLNTLAIITEAGLTFFEAIKKVCEVRKGVFVGELNKVLEEVELGILKKDALYRMAERCEVNEVSVFSFTLAQSLEKGTTGVALALKEQAGDAWTKRKNKAKEMGEKASIKLFFPMILLVFPCLAIFLLGPAILSIVKLLALR
ncbi:MAG: type II secretion system F family protein [Clostridiaceae bacterium]|nr:type II secretion system F family protein [Clostridiaceae bacterium]